MSSPQRCLEQAREAERLARLVSYERDRVRLNRQAAEWRARAAELQASDGGEATREVAVARERPSWVARTCATLRGRRSGVHDG